MSEEESCPLCLKYTAAIPQIIHWIQCSVCENWFHNHCLHLLHSESKKISQFHCPECSNKHGPSIYKRTSGRSRRMIDYVALDSGDVNTITLDQHPHVVEFIQWESQEQPDEINGDELLKIRTRLSRPVKIPADKRDGLGLEIPKDFNIDKVVESLGEDHPIEIMDVLTQNGIKGNWTLGSWRDYFKSPKQDRERILNVLSLEISKSSIGESIKRPKYVEKVDLVDKVWPKDLEFEKPLVKKYCLMGVENSYTDFHLDFAGTSVYYTVITGLKIFMFFPPTNLNLKKYVNWITNLNENKNFLGNLGLEKGIKVELNPGDALIIPSGWIHAVYTPIDTVVIGGNFLTSFNIIEQFKIIDIEIKTKVNKKFKFPNFSKLMWFTAKALIDEEIELDSIGMKQLDNYLKDQCEKLKDPKLKRVIKDSIPYKYVGKPLEFLKKYENFMENFNIDDGINGDISDNLVQQELTGKRERENNYDDEVTNNTDKKVKLEL